MKIVFMGTPAIAETALTELLRSGCNEIAAVYTRPDKPVGRKQVITPPPVKVRALENGIPVLQPATLRTPDAAATLAAMAPDLVVVAYGRILPPEVLAVPKYGCINLHVSQLPKYRGAAPIQWAVIGGEAETGVTIMQLDAGLDTGAVLARQTLEIGPDDTAGEVLERAGVIGARLLVRTVDAIAAGRAVAVPQQGEPSFAPQLDKAMAELDFSRPAAELHNLVRGCNPWPVAWFAHGDAPVKVLRSRLADIPAECPPSGEIISTAPLTVACGAGALVLEQVHPAGGRPMTGAEWSAGRRFKVGDKLR